MSRNFELPPNKAYYLRFITVPFVQHYLSKHEIDIVVFPSFNNNYYQIKNHNFQSEKQGYSGLLHRLIKITDRTLDVVFSRFLCVSFTITWKLKPKGVTRSRRLTGFLSVLFYNDYSNFFGLCIKVIVNETHRNIEKTISSVPSVILINLWSAQSNIEMVPFGI